MEPRSLCFALLAPGPGGALLFGCLHVFLDELAQDLWGRLRRQGDITQICFVAENVPLPESVFARGELGPRTQLLAVVRDQGRVLGKDSHHG